MQKYVNEVKGGRKMHIGNGKHGILDVRRKGDSKRERDVIELVT